MKKNKQKKSIIRIILIAIAVFVLAILGWRIYQRFGVQELIVENPIQIATVEAYTLNTQDLANLDTICRAEASINVDITPEVSGTINRLNVIDGQSVRKGQILLELDNIQQRVALQDARVALDSARLQLDEIQKNNDVNAGESLLRQTKNQQNIIIDRAFNTFLNTDLRAYPKDNPEDISRPAPQVIGNYQCKDQGTYTVDVYSSAADSGASFRFSGLESGISSVSLNTFGTDLGNCGLELQFQEGFDKNQEWIIPVPNTHSSQYFSAKKSYEQSLENRDILLNQTETSPELIGQQQGRVTQAQLRYQLAADNLEKTRIRSNVSGVINGLSVDQGDFASAFNSLGTIKTIDQLDLVTFVSLSDRNVIDARSLVESQGQNLEIGDIAQSADTQTRRYKITIPVTDNETFTEGEQYDCSIPRTATINTRSDGGVIIPLSAVSIIGTDSFIFEINEDNTITNIPVTTGALLGTEIVVYGPESGVFVKDARGLKPGDLVELAEIN